MGFQDNIPIYVQIGDDICRQIVSGRLEAGEKLPSVREYSSQYQVTPLTIQRAVQALENRGVVLTRKGVGSFVAPDAPGRLREEMVKSEVRDFLARMEHMGFDRETILRKVKEGMEDEK